MKQKLRFILMTLLCAVFSSAWGATVTDELNREFTGVKGTTYTEWSGKTSNSSAVYAGQSAGANESIQLRSKNSNSGIVSTTSGGKVKSITVTWNSNTQTGRTLNIYGSNTPYTSPTDLYNSNKQGTLLGTIVCGTSTSLTISGDNGDNEDYEYIGIRSASDALYLTSIKIVWEATVPAPTFSPEGGTYYSEQNVKISCKDENATIYYTLNGDDPTTESANFKGTGFVTIKVNTTLKAMAIDKDGNSSEIVSAIYTFKEMTSFENLTYLTVDTPADKYLVDPLNARVTYVCGQYAYIEDEDGGAIVLDKEGHGLTAGQTIFGAAVVDFLLNNGNPQITDIDLSDCNIEDGDAPNPFEVVISNWDYDFSTILNKYFKVTGATITKEDDKFYVQLGGDKVQLFGKGEAESIAVLDQDDTYTIVGFPTMDNTTKGLVIFVQPVGKAGTNDKPYTVAQARAAIDYGTGTTGVYATGIVSKIVTAYNNSNGYISYDISTDGSTTADQLRAYKGKSYEGANFTSADDIKVGDNVVIKGNLKKYSNIYEFDADNQLVSLVRPTIPIINVTSPKVELAYNATAGEIEYSIDNPVSGKSLQATANTDWISNITVTGEKVTFTTTVNDGETVRKATITLTYEGAKDVTVEVIQKLPDFATLPFTFDGGSTDIENKAGLTQNGLGKDYSTSPLLKFDGAGDYLILKINERPGKLTFDIKGNDFSGGSFKVQTSENGETYTDLQTYTEFGDNGNDKLSEEFENLGENVRYIKWIYTEKVSGNVGLGNITLAKFTGLNPDISFGETNFAITYGEPFTAPTLSNPHNVTVTYSSDNEDVASVDPETGEVTLNGVEGTVKITATSIKDETYGVGQASYTIAVTVIQKDNDDVFELVSTNDLAAGDEIIIVNVKETTTPANEETGTEATTQYSYMGLGTLQKENNRAAIEVNANNDGTLKGNNKLQVITLEVATKTNAETNEVTKTDNWWLNVGNGYLYAAGGKDGNYLRTEDTPDANGRADAKITFNDEGDDDISIEFQTTATKRNNLKYNSSSELFSCYESGQDPVKIYRKKGIPGDANNDGIVSVADVMLVVNYVLGNNPTNFNFKNANVNNDEKITVADVMAIVKIVLGN